MFTPFSPAGVGSDRFCLLSASLLSGGESTVNKGVWDCGGWLAAWPPCRVAET